MSLEELIPSNHSKSYIYAIFIRTGLVISTLVVGLMVPFFGLVMSLIGSLLTMLVTLILPCACFPSILRGKISRLSDAEELKQTEMHKWRRERERRKHRRENGERERGRE